MLTPIDDNNIGHALDLLAEGFAETRTRAFWESMLPRLDAFGGNKAAGVPIGFLIDGKPDPVGVMITPASIRPGRDGAAPTKIINVASSYVKPEHRWRTPMLMRAATRLKPDLLLDLTPTAKVQEMLAALGYKPINRGVAVNILPLTLAAGPWRGKVINLSEAPAEAASSDVRAMLLAHEPYNCTAAALRVGDVWAPLLFKVKPDGRGFRTAIPLYCPDNALMHANLGALAGFLLQRGVTTLRLDLPLEGTAPGVERLGRDMKFAIGTPKPGAIDYAGTELALFDL